MLVSWIRAGGRFKRHYCNPFKVAAFNLPSCWERQSATSGTPYKA